MDKQQHTTNHHLHHHHHRKFDEPTDKELTDRGSKKRTGSSCARCR
jgi:hypothetical protein